MREAGVQPAYIVVRLDELIPNYSECIHLHIYDAHM